MFRKMSLDVGVGALIALGLAAVPSFTLAQSTSSVPPGAFVYLRDVAPRPAQAKEPPGTPHYVALDQSALIFSTLGGGLAPLADHDIGNVSAASFATMPNGAIGTPEFSALSNLPSEIGSATSGAHSAEASGVAAPLNIPLQAINDAMSSLKASLGGPH